MAAKKGKRETTTKATDRQRKWRARNRKKVNDTRQVGLKGAMLQQCY